MRNGNAGALLVNVILFVFLMTLLLMAAGLLGGIGSPELLVWLSIVFAGTLVIIWRHRKGARAEA